MIWNTFTNGFLIKLRQVYLSFLPPENWPAGDIMVINP